ncbi:ABC transporter permease [Paenibacillus antibioticophila]|uniref:ABC transporter permease n=1 Tax=Paenibacillus antibioticophila TaxID=1274374 RepID=UPI0005CA0FFF|nr:ABC transporter permease subunit [Paenibacillus antibioticophila]
MKATSSLRLENKPRKKIHWKSYIPLYLLALPALIYLLINNYLPLYGMQIAFRELDFSGSIFSGKFVWFDNFKFLFATDNAWIMTRNTVLYNLLFIVVGTVFSVAVTILFNEIMSKKIAKFYQSAVLIPYFISMVIVGYLVFAFLSSDNGFINHSILKPLGIDPISWYSEPKYWPFILLFIHTWKAMGYNLMFYTARIITISKDYYEAAKIDGATKWQQIRHITLPLLKPVIILTTILAIGRIFYSDFGLFYQVPMNSGALYDVTTTIDTYSFRALMNLGDITMSTATGVYQSVVGFILILIANAVIKKISKEDSLF